GIFSGLGHALFNSSPVLGASGAVAAVTGAYMVLFPKTYVRIIYIIFFIGTAEFPAFYFILLKLVIWDNLAQVAMNTTSNIAYGAHLVGYAFGIGIPMALLALKLLPHSHFDLWAVARQWHRREKFRHVVKKGYDPFSITGTGRKTVSSKVTDPQPLTPEQLQVQKLRADISQAVSTSNLNEAIDAYYQILKIEPEHVLPQQQQLDIANKLAHLGQHEQAAHAYELFIKSYSRYPFLEQVQLMLGLIYSRYLKNQEKARQHLQAAFEKLSNPIQRQMCQDELENL
ncbi:MAG: rhomboid family intramembrane serine protease, partial [Planctomycetes bacterium]|nr:rhomboid family intramembrane serine protease [Planctomycetota bacterium]